MTVIAKLTPEQEKAQALRAAKILQRSEEFLDGAEGLSKVNDRIKLLEQNDEALKGLNAKEIAENLEKLKAGQEKLSRQIKSSKRGTNYISGVEDEADNFSLLKYARGVKRGEWKGAGLEHEIYKQLETKAQNTQDYGAGGAFVPDQVIPDIIPAIYAASVFVNLDGEGQTTISVLDGLVGGDVKIPKFDGGLIAYWIGEEDDYALSQTKTADVTLKRHKLGVLAKLTDEMQKFASYGFEALFRRDMVRAAVEKLDYTIAFGTGGDHTPRGIAHMDGIKIYKSGTEAPLTRTEALATTFAGAVHTLDDVEKMKLFLEEDKITLDQNAPIISSPRYFSQLKQLKYITHSGQTTDKPYLLGGILSDQRLSELMGLSIGKGVQIPSNAVPGLTVFTGANSDAKHTGVFLGNLREFILGRWAGIEVVSDEGLGSGMVSDHTYVKFRMHAGTVGRQTRALVFCPDAKVRA